MILVNENQERALVGLSNDFSFKVFLQMLQDIESDNIGQMLTTQNPVLLHQLQGETRMLVDIRQAVTQATEAAAAKVRYRS